MTRLGREQASRRFQQLLQIVNQQVKLNVLATGELLFWRALGFVC
jgi:hypothetical protein